MPTFWIVYPPSTFAITHYKLEWDESKKTRRANKTCLLPYITRSLIEGDMRVLGWSHFRRVIFSRRAFRADREPARKELLKAKELWTYITAKERRYGVNLNSIYLSHLLICDWVRIWEGWRNPQDTHKTTLFKHLTHTQTFWALWVRRTIVIHQSYFMFGGRQLVCSVGKVLSWFMRPNPPERCINL